jgi:hypothetical protein
VNFRKLIRALGVAALAVALAPAPALAQTVTTSDVQRLQDTVDDASREVGRLRSRDSGLASQLETELEDVRDEATYLRVKMRKDPPVSRSEFAEVRDRAEDIRARARGEASGRYTPPVGTTGTGSTSSSSRRGVLPVGTELDVRLQTRLSSKTAQVEDRFEATTLVDVQEGERVLIPAGSMMRGIVSSVQRAGRLERKGSITVMFDQIEVNGRTYPMRATVTEALESEGIRGEAGRIGAGAGIGAIIGGILGGFKGALAGILIGGGGTIAATEGQDVELPAGTILRVRLDTPLEL